MENHNKDINKRFDKIDKAFFNISDTSIKINERLDRIEQNMATKDDLNKLTNTLDQFMKQVMTVKQESLATKARIDRLEKNISIIAEKVGVQIDA